MVLGSRSIHGLFLLFVFLSILYYAYAFPCGDSNNSTKDMNSNAIPLIIAR